MTLGDVIKTYRDENKVSMEYVANLCGITKGYVAMLEKNVNSKTGRPVKPTIETIVKVCNGLHLDFNSVFDSLDDDYEINISTSRPPSSAPELELTEQEERLVENFHRLSDSQQARLLAYLDGLLDAGRDVKGKDAGGSELTDLLYYDYKPASGMVAEPIAEYNCGRKTQAKKSAGEPVTIAAHHDSEDWTEEELAEIEKFKKYVKTERE